MDKAEALEEVARIISRNTWRNKSRKTKGVKIENDELFRLNVLIASLAENSEPDDEDDEDEYSDEPCTCCGSHRCNCANEDCNFG